MPAATDEAPATEQQEQSAEPAAAPAPKQDSLVFCHSGPTHVIPTLSVFVMKLETYFRMTDIPYKEEFSLKKSSKGKIPYIKDNGKEVTDTNFIIQYLNEKCEKDLNASLTDQEQAISLAFKRMIEENLYWTQVHYRWIENWSTSSKMLPITGVRKKLLPLAGALWFKPSIKSNLYGHGMGRHSNEEIRQIAEKDLRALSVHLGGKPFFMGDEPTEVDASLFAFLAQALYTIPGNPFQKLIKENLQNLNDYTDRMKEKYFPDWDQKLLPEKKKEEEQAAEKKEETAANAEGKDAATNGEDKEAVTNGADKEPDANGEDKKVEESVSKPDEAAQAEGETQATEKSGGDAAEEQKQS